MRIIGFFLVACVGLVSCGSADKPDVSGIDVGKVHIERFDTAFFSLDSNNIPRGLFQLSRRYPYFTPDFVANILGSDEQLSDTSRLAFAAAREFLVTYHGVEDSLKQKYKQLDWLEPELQQGFRYVKYYFPQYKLPPKVVAFTGPFDGPGVAITSYTLAIGLQSYAGANFSFYLTSKGQDMYPLYVSRRFKPEYITANCLNAIAQDIFPDSSDNRPLIEQMVIKGRYFWLAGKLDPDAPDSIRTDYTQAQLNWCAGNEASIWNFFLQATDLYTLDPDIIKNYIGEGPKTLGMPDASPGNIGAWVGWQIVKKYVAEHGKLTPAQVMATPARTIFEEAKYKPK
ncbi:gliding motility lipoprotein GldB [Puia dinghuensis]|uniref:Gliding motility lipoprotein GldB n=1 Tax=Puia dinghuensis TaxID=1792502 RepID=A0A8J2UGH2_9BACT|nr:hypothetical protein [Puia dinghuensis]GGB13968.1 gliding motility lipoprotein GldB [Puia dinghuensis]